MHTADHTTADLKRSILDPTNDFWTRSPAPEFSSPQFGCHLDLHIWVNYSTPNISICIYIYINYTYIIYTYFIVYIYIHIVFPLFSHDIWVNDIKSLLGMNYMCDIEVNLNRMNGNIIF